MRIKKMFLIMLTISMINLCAEELDELYKNYMSTGGKISDEIKEIIKKDEYYQNAVEEIKNPLVEKKEAKDPEAMKLMQLNIKKIDWNRVYENLVKSNNVYQNPISAYYGVYIINKYMGQVNKLDDYKKFSETLYAKEKNMCQSFLNYGAIFEKGLGSPINISKAIEVYEEGLRLACKDGWQKQVVESKLLSLKRK